MIPQKFHCCFQTCEQGPQRIELPTDKKLFAKNLRKVSKYYPKNFLSLHKTSDLEEYMRAPIRNVLRRYKTSGLIKSISLGNIYVDRLGSIPARNLKFIYLPSRCKKRDNNLASKKFFKRCKTVARVTVQAWGLQYPIMMSKVNYFLRWIKFLKSLRALYCQDLQVTLDELLKYALHQTKTNLEAVSIEASPFIDGQIKTMEEFEKICNHFNFRIPKEEDPPEMDKSKKFKKNPESSLWSKLRSVAFKRCYSSSPYESLQFLDVLQEREIAFKSKFLVKRECVNNCAKLTEESFPDFGGSMLPEPLCYLSPMRDILHISNVYERLTTHVFSMTDLLHFLNMKVDDKYLQKAKKMDLESRKERKEELQHRKSLYLETRSYCPGKNFADIADFCENLQAFMLAIYKCDIKEDDWRAYKNFLKKRSNSLKSLILQIQECETSTRGFLPFVEGLKKLKVLRSLGIILVDSQEEDKPCESINDFQQYNQWWNHLGDNLESLREINICIHCFVKPPLKSAQIKAKKKVEKVGLYLEGLKCEEREMLDIIEFFTIKHFPQVKYLTLKIDRDVLEPAFVKLVRFLKKLDYIEELIIEYMKEKDREKAQSELASLMKDKKNLRAIVVYFEENIYSIITREEANNRIRVWSIGEQRFGI